MILKLQTYYTKMINLSHENNDLCFEGYLLVTTRVANCLMGFRGPKRPSDLALFNLNT